MLYTESASALEEWSGWTTTATAATTTGTATTAATTTATTRLVVTQIRIEEMRNNNIEIGCNYSLLSPSVSPIIAQRPERNRLY